MRFKSGDIGIPVDEEAVGVADEVFCLSWHGVVLWVLLIFNILYDTLKKMGGEVMWAVFISIIPSASIHLKTSIICVGFVSAIGVLPI